MTSHTIKVNGKQMSVVTHDSVEVLLRNYGWRWTNAKIELVKPHSNNKHV